MPYRHYGFISLLPVFVVSLILLIPLSILHAVPSGLIIQDIFGRTLNDKQIILVDWEGQLANPAMQFTAVPPANTTYPAYAMLSANGGRLYFDVKNNFDETVSAIGPTLKLNFPDATPQTFYFSIFPDRAGGDEDYTLTATFYDAVGESTVMLPVHVIDQDIERLHEFNIHLDFAEDESGFFANPQAQAVAQLVADDWSYFIADMNLDTVSAQSEISWIGNYPNGWHNPDSSQWAHMVRNKFDYTGLLIYMYGITCEMPDPCPDTTKFGSGGGPSDYSFQLNNGVKIEPGLRRSGGINLETHGYYNLNGWYISGNDDDWQTPHNGTTNDLYSLLLHEVGHVFAYHTYYPTMLAPLNSQNIQNYYGNVVAMEDGGAHFPTVVDPLSRFGVFGNEYYENFNGRRWLITRLDLFMLEAVGYKLRETSAIAPLQLVTTTLPRAESNVPYSITLNATGGLPAYHWSLVEGQGSLPDGFTLDSFTGELKGIPTADGRYDFSVKLCDYNSGTDCVVMPMILNIGIVPGTAPEVVRNITVNVKQGRPTIEWDTDINGQWFNVWVGDSNGVTWHMNWYPRDPSEAVIQGQAPGECVENHCTLTPNMDLLSGTYSVWIQTWGYGSLGTGGPFVEFPGWNGPASFTLLNVPPGPISPMTITTSNGTTSLSWQGAERATWYNVWVGTDGTGDPAWTPQFFDWMLAENLGCENTDQCVLTTGVKTATGTANLNLPAGEYIWYVQSWGPGGFSTGGSFDPPLDAWVEGSKFTVP